MKRILAAGVVAMLAATHVLPAFADWDPELEAQEQREREAAAREQAARDAAAQKMKREAEAKYRAEQLADKRKYLGAAANGKSDAEVDRLYDQKVAQTKNEAMDAWNEGQRKLKSPQGKAATKEVTGYTMEEMQNMSDEELDALAKKMEQKYGGGN